MTTMKTFLAVKNEGTVPQIFIQGFIGSSWFFEGNTDKGIKNIFIVSPAIAIIEAALAAKPLITTLTFALFDLSKLPIAIP